MDVSVKKNRLGQEDGGSLGVECQSASAGALGPHQDALTWNSK